MSSCQSRHVRFVSMLFSICNLHNIRNKQHCRSKVRLGKLLVVVTRTHPLCRDAGENRSWESPPSPRSWLSASTQRAGGGHPRHYSITSALFPCPKASELLCAPRVLIWPLFLRQELQRASALLWVKPAPGPGWFCWLCVCQYILITVLSVVLQNTL